jgi:hypothetical protein
MSVYSIQSTTRASAPALADQPVAPADPALAQASLLARVIGEVLLANVQNTASLNHTAARALLMHARIPEPPGLEHSDEAWRLAWRSFEICATSADRIVNLTRVHAQRTTAALWQAVESITAELARSHSARVAQLRASLQAMRDAQAACWQATQQAHRDLLALAQESAQEQGHGTH